MRNVLVLGALVLAGGIYVAAQAPQGGAPGGRQGAPPAGRGGGMLGGAGPSDKPIVDPAAADRGRKTWASECIDCHGTHARGGDKGSNLVRSVVVLRDRYGSQLGPYLKKGHKMQSGASSAALTAEQIQDLAHFLRQRVNDTLRGSPLFQPQNVLTGDPKAGEAFFKGEGQCMKCHSTGTGTSTASSLAGIGTRLEPIDLQQRFLFPATGRGGRGGRGAAPTPATAVRVTVTPPGGAAVSGLLIQMDDFFVSLRREDGTTQTFRRVQGMTVQRHDPLAFHIELLDRLTDKNMHDVVAYLETLK